MAEIRSAIPVCPLGIQPKPGVLAARTCHHRLPGPRAIAIGGLTAPTTGLGPINAGQVDQRWLSLDHQGLERFNGGGLALTAEPTCKGWNQLLQVGGATARAIQPGIDGQGHEATIGQGLQI